MQPLSPRTLYLLIGPPGCGKSVVAWQLVSRGGLRVSGDDLFFAITDKTHSFWLPHRVMDAVNHAADLLLQGLIERDLPVIADRTHLSRAARARPIELARAAGYRVEALLWMNFDQAFERNAQRSGRDRVPDAIWRSMVGAFEEPSLDEGIDSLTIIAGLDRA